MNELIFAMISVFFASCLQGMIGFGAGLLSMSLLSIFWSVLEATTILNPLGLFLNISLAWQNRHQVSLRKISILLIGVPVGIYLGLHILHIFSEPQLKLILGITLLVAVVNILWPRPLLSVTHPIFGAIAGIFSGVCGVSISSSGPPILIYASFSGWDKESYRANLSVFFGLTSFLSCLGLFYSGFLTSKTLTATGLLIPVSLLGSVAGYRFGTVISPLHFMRLTVTLLIIMAISLITMSTRSLLH